MKDEELNKIKTKYTLLLILCTVLGTVIIMTGIYFWFIKSDNKPIDNNQTINEKEETKKLYNIVDGNEYEVYFRSVSSDQLKKELDLSYDYPLFNIDTVELKKANEDIKKVYDDIIKYNSAKEVDVNSALGYSIKNDNKYYSNDGTLWNIKYDVSETDNYLSIAIIKSSLWDGAGEEEVYSYVVDKKTNKLLTNSEIIKLFNVAEKDFLDFLNKDNYCAAVDKIDNTSLGTLFIQNKKLAYARNCGGPEISIYNK